MAKQRPARKTHQIIRSFEARALRKRPLSLKIADALTSYFGTLGFLLFNLIIFIFWILINTGKFPAIPIFDPYPFVLLITAVSLEAIVLTTIVLMSQNRQSRINTLRDELQLQVNIIAQKEITKALRLLSKILEKHGVKLKDKELEEMLIGVDTAYIEKKIEEQLLGKPEPVTKRFEKTLKK